MAFSKSFPKTFEGLNYPKWVEIYLSDSEEHTIESETRDLNIKLMKECISDAKKIVSDMNLNNYQSDVISLAISLFEKRSSHVAYMKERFCKDKFDAQNK